MHDTHTHLSRVFYCHLETQKSHTDPTAEKLHRLMDFYIWKAFSGQCHGFMSTQTKTSLIQTNTELT